MTYCKNLKFGGYTVKDSGNWAHTLFKCENIYAHDLTVLGGHDGFHMRVGRNVLIENCEFRTGDECIAGFANEPHRHTQHTPFLYHGDFPVNIKKTVRQHRDSKLRV